MWVWENAIKIFFFILYSIIFLSCNTDTTTNIYVNNGIVDLRNNEDTLSSPITLNGSWKFYWNHLVSSTDEVKQKRLSHEYIYMPLPWNRQKCYTSHPAFGYATYHSTIVHSKNIVGSIMSIKLPYTFTSYAVHIDGVLVARSGIVADSKETMVPNQLPSIIQFLVQSSTTDIFIQVANYQQRNGGILNPIYYGKLPDIHNMYYKSISIQLFALASLIILGIYHIALFFINKLKQYLYLGIFSIVVAVRICLIDEMLLISFFDIPWSINFRLSYLTITLTPILFVLFVKNMYPSRINKKAATFFIALFSFYSLWVCYIDVQVLSYSLIFIQVSLLLVSCYLLVILIKETSKNFNTKLLFYLGIIASSICLLNDILYTNNILNTINTSHFGILLFILAQSLITFEEFTNNQKRFYQLSKEIEIAKNLKQKILPKITPNIINANITTHYFPSYSIGNDFYYFYEINNNSVGIFLADISGGFSSSIITSSVYIALTLQNSYLEQPNIILSNINTLLYNKVGNCTISCLYCYLNTESMIFKISSAGNLHPLYYNALEGIIHDLKIHESRIGINPAMQYTSLTLNIKKGDKIFLYTDGLLQLLNNKKDSFDLNNLVQFFTQYVHLSGNEFTNTLKNSIINLVGKEYSTRDITIITIEIP